MDHGALAVRALAADGLGAGAHGHHGHVHFQQEGLALLVQLAGQTAFIRDDAFDARRGRGLVHEIGEAEAHIGTARFQAFLDRGQQAAHRLVVDFVVPFFQRFDEAAHVRALERGGQIHTKVHPGHGLAAALGAVAHQQGHGDAADADAVDRNIAPVHQILNVGQGIAGLIHINNSQVRSRRAFLLLFHGVRSASQGLK